MNSEQFAKLRDEFDAFMEEYHVYNTRKLPLERYNYTSMYGDNGGYWFYTINKNTNQIILLGFAQEQDYQLNDTSDYSYGLDFTLLIAKNNGSPTLPLVDKENWAVIVNQIETLISADDRLHIFHNEPRYVRAQDTLYKTSCAVWNE